MLELQTAGREDTIEGDPALLARALENLVRNSIRHNPGGCTVTVTVDREPETCRFTVQDDGVGMTAAAMERANAGQFEAAQNGAQHGFGLRLVYGIAAAHGGTIVVQQQEGRGSRAVVSLPLRPPEKGEVLKTPAMGFDGSGGFSDVLVELSGVLPYRAFLPEDLE